MSTSLPGRVMARRGRTDSEDWMSRSWRALGRRWLGGTLVVAMTAAQPAAAQQEAACDCASSVVLQLAGDPYRFFRELREKEILAAAPCVQRCDFSQDSKRRTIS